MTNICCQHLQNYLLLKSHATMAQITVGKLCLTRFALLILAALNFLCNTSIDILWENRLTDCFASGKSSRQRELSVDTFNTMGRVDILDQGNLVAGS
jgi:hypothetical protein